MTKPVILLRLIPDLYCVVCGNFGYVHATSHVCCKCVDPQVAALHRRMQQAEEWEREISDGLTKQLRRNKERS